MLSIKKFRNKAVLSQESVAAHVGVGRSAVAIWETGKTSPRAEALPKLATLLGCTVDELLTEQSAYDRV